MIRKKICMLGAFAVGKTSLVRRFVTSIFSEQYKTTLGVRIDKKSLEVMGQEVDLILWDLAGEDAFVSVNVSYLKGSSGFLFVVDGTRPDTLNTALDLQERVDREHAGVPRIFLLNKSDLEAGWKIDAERLKELEESGVTVMKTSALSGEGVEASFTRLAEAMLRA